MKKILILATVLFLSLHYAAVFASCTKSIQLMNVSKDDVTFSTAADPGYIPQVKSGDEYTLPGDFMMGCDKNSLCTIEISPINNPSTITSIHKVPRGARIFYLHPGNDGYYLESNAGVCTH